MPSLAAKCLDVKISGLRSLLAELHRVIICFSGGVDSGYLLAEAVRVLGDHATALTAVSPSLAPQERSDAERLAQQLGACHILVEPTNSTTLAIPQTRSTDATSARARYTGWQSPKRIVSAQRKCLTVSTPTTEVTTARVDVLPENRAFDHRWTSLASERPTSVRQLSV